MSEDTPNFSIADDYDPDGDMSADADPVSACLTYLADIEGSCLGDMGFPWRMSRITSLVNVQLLMLDN